MVSAMKDKVGVVQIMFGSAFVTAEARAFITESEYGERAFQEQNQLEPGDPAMREFRTQYFRDNPFPYATVDDVLDHIDRAVALAGIDHVGVGSDFDGVGPTLPTRLKDVADYPNLAAGLVARGYSETDIEKILGGNLLRVWGEVEDYARQHGYSTLCTHAP